MKTRLPKSLLAAILCAVTASTVSAEELYINVGTANDFQVSDSAMDNSYLPSKKSIYVHSGDLSLSGTQKVGTLDVNENFFVAGDTDKYSYTGSKGLFGSASITPNKVGTVSKNLQVTGNLTINEDAQVSLGGHYYTEIKGTLTTYKYAEYTGLVAENVEINGSGKVANLQSMAAYIGNLTVNSGLVNLHTTVNSGNTSFMLKTNDAVMPSDSKQVQIKTALTVNNGTVIIGKAEANHEANDKHVVTTFGSYSYSGTPVIAGSVVTGISNTQVHSSLITQKDGVLEVHGKSASVGGLNIDQQGGVMSISNDSIGGYHLLADYGDSTIKQSGDESTRMTIGVIKAYNSYYGSITENLKENGVSVDINPSISVEQTGAGTINLSGVYFINQETEAASTEISSISQSGSGTINLSGTYSGVTFDVEQTGSGAIKLNSSMSLNTVTLDDSTATPIAEGKESGLYIGKDAEVTARTLSIDGGKLVNNGKLTVTGATDSTYALRTAAATPINITDGELVNSGTIEGAITMSGGKLVAETGSTIAGISATGGEIEVVGDITMTGDLVMDDAAALIFDDPTATINLGDYDFIFNGGNIAVTLTNEELDDLSQVVLFTNADAETNWGEYEVAIVDENGKTSGKAVLNFTDNATGDVTITVVPEPTSALLSLVGLVAFTLRRRRR